MTWGYSTAINLYNCDPQIIKDKEKIKVFIKNLVELIDMKAYKEPQIVHFGTGEVEGFTFVQLIETSLISGHFANESNSAYLDIFSCKPYDANLAANFIRKYFKAQSFNFDTLERK
jgi:S-adenosylmethionine/arginine decarboxylase-like enzyme